MTTKSAQLVKDLEKDIEPLPVPEFPERLLMDLCGRCNLRCPMCLRHGTDDEDARVAAIGNMSLKEAESILDEVMDAQPLVQPTMYGEPLLAPDFKKHIRNMKDRGIGVAINTNGLTMNEDIAQFLVDIKLDALFFSLDSVTPETFEKIRGVDQLDKLKRNLEMTLKVRSDATLPRIGATFTVQDDNRHESEAFVEEWIDKVDVVRLGNVYEDGKIAGLEVREERVPCRALYVTMPVASNGDSVICCHDAFSENVMGNVFKDGGVKAVWHGEKFTEARHYHETGQWDKIPFCKNCNAWTGHQYEDEVRDGILIRRSQQFEYYNRIDRLENWTENLRGHEQPDQNDGS